jgi:hypothetical protein
MTYDTDRLTVYSSPKSQMSNWTSADDRAQTAAPTAPAPKTAFDSAAATTTSGRTAAT